MHLKFCSVVPVAVPPRFVHFVLQLLHSESDLMSQYDLQLLHIDSNLMSQCGK